MGGRGGARAVTGDIFEVRCGEAQVLTSDEVWSRIEDGDEWWPWVEGRDGLTAPGFGR